MPERRGGGNSKARLTSEMVISARELYRNGHSRGQVAQISENDVAIIKRFALNGVPRAELAARFSIALSTLKKIIAGTTWRDVKPAPIGESFIKRPLADDKGVRLSDPRLPEAFRTRYPGKKLNKSLAKRAIKTASPRR